jgi:hypothetical protein
MGNIMSHFSPMKQKLLLKYPKCQAVHIGGDGLLTFCDNAIRAEGADVIEFGKIDNREVSVDLHHGILGRNKRFKEWVNVEWNFQPTGVVCNRLRLADNWHNAMYWLEHQIEELGHFEMKLLLNALPTGLKKGGDWRDAHRHMIFLEVGGESITDSLKRR